MVEDITASNFCTSSPRKGTLGDSRNATDVFRLFMRRNALRLLSPYKKTLRATQIMVHGMHPTPAY